MHDGGVICFDHDGDPMTTAKSLGDVWILETELRGDEHADDDSDHVNLENRISTIRGFA